MRVCLCDNTTKKKCESKDILGIAPECCAYRMRRTVNIKLAGRAGRPGPARIQHVACRRAMCTCYFVVRQTCGVANGRYKTPALASLACALEYVAFCKRFRRIVQKNRRATERSNMVANIVGPIRSASLSPVKRGGPILQRIGRTNDVCMSSINRRWCAHKRSDRCALLIPPLIFRRLRKTSKVLISNGCHIPVSTDVDSTHTHTHARAGGGDVLLMHNRILIARFSQSESICTHK